MAGWITCVVGEKAVFLHGDLEHEEEINTKIQEGCEKFWEPEKFILVLKETIQLQYNFGSYC